MRILLTLALITCTVSVQAATVSRSHPRPVHRVQQHYSFVPPRKPIAAKPPGTETKPLMGQVLQTYKANEPIKPISTCSSIALPRSNPPVTKRRAHFSAIKRLWQPKIIAGRNESAAITLTSNEAAQLSAIALEMIQSVAKSGDSIYLLPTPKSEKQLDRFSPSLLHSLQGVGFHVATEPNDLSTSVRYRVLQFKKTYMLNIKVNTTQLTRLYQTINGSLVAASPLSSTKEQP